MIIIAREHRVRNLPNSDLLGAPLNSVSYSFNNEQEGRVTAVVAKVKYQRQPRIKPSRELNTLLGVATVMKSSKFY